MINKMKDYPIFDNPTSIYKVNGFSMQELLSKYWEYINRVIRETNKVREDMDLLQISTDEFMKWVRDEGLSEETKNVIEMMYDDGRLGQLINESLMNDINQKLKEIDEKKFNKTGGEMLGAIHTKYKYFMIGDVGEEGFITKNNAKGRDELLIYSSNIAYLEGSKGAGIHIYGNEDRKHPGCIAFLVGENNKGTIKNMIDQEGKLVVGNDIITFTDNHENYGQLTIKNPKKYPAIYILESNNSDGEIAVKNGEFMRFGSYSKENGFDTWLKLTDKTITYKNNILPSFNNNIQIGKERITPVANERTTVTVRFKTPFYKIPIVVLTPVSSVVGTILLECGVSNITKESFDITILRKNTTSTNINWVAMIE